MHTKAQHPALDLANKQGLVRARELARVGATGGTLQQLLKTGSLVRVGRGVYAPADRKQTELDDLGPIAIQYPRLVFLFADRFAIARVDNTVSTRGVGCCWSESASTQY